jgi:hypothetical protein
MPDFGDKAVRDALADDLPDFVDDDSDDSGEPEPREVDFTDGRAVITRGGRPAAWRDPEGATDDTAPTEPDSDPDDGLTVEATDEIGDTDPDGDSDRDELPQARQRRRPPRRQRRAWRESETDSDAERELPDDHDAPATTADSVGSADADELVDARHDELTADADDSDPADPPSTYDDDDAPTLSPETQSLSPGYGPADTDSDDTGTSRGTSTVTASGEVWPDPPDGRPTAEAVAVAALWLPLGALAFAFAGPLVAVPVALGWMVVSLPVLVSSTAGRGPEVAT